MLICSSSFFHVDIPGACTPSVNIHFCGNTQCNHDYSALLSEALYQLVVVRNTLSLNAGFPFWICLPAGEISLQDKVLNKKPSLEVRLTLVASHKKFRCVFDLCGLHAWMLFKAALGHMDEVGKVRQYLRGGGGEKGGRGGGGRA